MTSLPQNISHEYDPKIVFHSHSANLPHLNSWIEDMISLTEKNLPAKTTPTTDDLVNSLQRYDVVFRELLRQTSIFSEPVTKMYAKLWAGVLKLLDYMIKSYHRYVKHTSHLQNQAQSLLSERQREEASHKIAKEESDLERTTLRAAIRNLESELESIKMAKFGVENENKKMRYIINMYIKSSELNDPVWDVLDEDEFGLAESHKKDAQNTKNSKNSKKSAEELLTKEQFGIGSRRKDAVDAGRMQLKTLNRLDIELNEILSNVLKEENRQRLLMQGLTKLIEKHKDHFFPQEEEISEKGGTVSANSEAPVGSAMAVAKVQTTHATGLHNAHQKHTGNTLDGPLLMTIEDQRDCITVGIQVDEKDEFGVVDEEPPEDVKEEDMTLLGVAPLAPLKIFTPGSDQPYQLRRLMSTYPKILRVPPVAWTCTTVMAIYLDKIQIDEEAQSKGLMKRSLPEHVYDYFLRTTGLRSAADVHVAQLVKALESHTRRQPRISLFASQLGLTNKDEPPPMDQRDTDFILDILRQLLKQGELMPDFHKTMVKKGHVGKNSVVLRPDVLRLAAVHAVQNLFHKMLPDNGDDYVMKVKSMVQTDRGSRYVDVDNLIDCLIEPWHTVRSTWEEHARFLFHEFCTVNRVLQEATFATDEGVESSDSILVEVHKASAMDCIRRPMRLFQKGEAKESDLSGATGGATGTNMPAGNVNKEPVCETMNRKNFFECLKTVVPTITSRETDKIFEDALEIAHEQVLRTLEVMWRPFVDDASHYNQGNQHHHGSQNLSHKNLGTNRTFWVNMRTTLSQWSRPYRKKLFRSQDIEIDTFVAILVRNNIFQRSPLLELLHFPPKDLWPNADMFMRQLKERDRLERLGGMEYLTQNHLLHGGNSDQTNQANETVSNSANSDTESRKQVIPSPRISVLKSKTGKPGSAGRSKLRRPSSGRPGSAKNVVRPNSSKAGGKRSEDGGSSRPSSGNN